MHTPEWHKERIQTSITRHLETLANMDAALAKMEDGEVKQIVSAERAALDAYIKSLEQIVK